MGVILRGGGAKLPSPTEIRAADEIIWSANTGRSASGLMLGDVAAEKRTFAIEWGVLTKAEYESIRAALRSGFIPFSVEIDGSTTTLTAYRGTLTGEFLGVYGGETYYRSASVSVIER